VIIRWIVVDGIDGSGKSTIGSMILDHYRGQGERAHMISHPSERLLGRISRRALRGRGRMLKLVATTFFILDVLASVIRLRGYRKRYQTLIFIRYLMGAAYLPRRLAPLGYDFFSKLLPVPRRLLLVDIEPRVAVERIGEREEEKEMFEDLDSLVRVRDKVLMLAQDDWDIVDNSGDSVATRSSVLEIIDRWDLEESSRSPSS
jgi:dTMP kinase